MFDFVAERLGDRQVGHEKWRQSGTGWNGRLTEGWLCMKQAA